MALLIPDFDSVEQALEWVSVRFPQTEWHLQGIDEHLIQVVVRQYTSLALEFPVVAQRMTRFAVADGFDKLPNMRGDRCMAVYQRAEDCREIWLNWDYWTDQAKLEQAVTTQIAHGLLCGSTNPIAGLLTHEFAHAVYCEMLDTEQYVEWRDMPPVYFSKYAEENDYERFAEAFVNYYHTGMPSDCAKRTVELAKQAFGLTL